MPEMMSSRREERVALPRRWGKGLLIPILGIKHRLYPPSLLAILI